MWTDKTSIQTKFLRNMITIALVSIGLWCVIWIHGEYSAFKVESESLRTKYTESQKEMLKSEVVSVVKYIDYVKSKAEQEMRRTLKERVYEACEIALNIYRNNRTSKTPSEISNLIKDALRPIRFNNGRGYYFAVSMDGVEQLYPVRPEFEGKNLIDLQDSKGSYVIQDEINIIQKYGEGFVTDYWVKPDKDIKILFPKISFVKHFKPLNWYFGTGEYLEDAKEQIQNEVLNRIADLRFGAEGYFFGSTFTGGSLFSNGKITKASSNIWDLTDPNGVKIIQEQRRAAQNPGGGFVFYFWHKLNASEPSPKISYVQGITGWKWTIGAGAYLDTIENVISAKRKTLEKGLRKKLINSSFILIALLLLIYFWSKQISYQLANAIKTFSASLKRADTTAITVNPDSIDLLELKNIAELTNKMLDDRKKAEASLRESEEKFRNFSEQSLVGIYLIQDSRFKYVNPKFAEIFGYSVEECSNDMLFHDLVHPDDIATVEEQVRKRVSGEIKSVQYSFRGVKKNGDTIYVEIFGSSISAKGKSIVIGTMLDITERKQAEEALRESEEKFRAVVEDTPILICRFISEGIITFVNDAYCKYFDKSLSQLIGKSFYSFIPESDRKTVISNLSTLTAESPVKTHEHRVIGPDGEIYWQKWTNHAMFNKHEEVTTYQAIGEDITLLKKTEKEKLKLESQLQQSQKMETIGTLAGGIAHDFNNILFPIVGYSEMLLQDVPEDSPLRASLDEIYSGSLRARDLVKQILTFSRQDSGEIKLIKIQPVIKEAVKLIRSTIPTSINIKQHIQTDPIIIKADPTKIHQVVMNLATNAYHAMEDTGGMLKVNLKQVELGEQDTISLNMEPGTFACLTIADTGMGIDDNVKGKIFDPFFTTKKQGKGTGMGLSVVHGIVINAGGDIQVHSELGKGTEFHVYLPVEMRHPATQELQPSEPLQGGTEQILLVDDEAPIVFMEKQMLERLGYQVVSHISSVEALEAFRTNPGMFNVVITDMAMPNMSGDQLSSELIKIRPDIPILLCTGFSENIPKEKAESMGIKGFLMKPIVMKDLSDKIREVLGDADDSVQES